MTNINNNHPRADLSELRLENNGVGLIGVRKHITAIPIKKPPKQSFIFMHPVYKFDAAVIKHEEDNNYYLVRPELQMELFNEWKPMKLIVSITRQEDMFIWPISLPKDESNRMSWHDSALEIVDQCEGKWFRVVPNLGLQAYECYTPEVDFPEPKWEITSEEKIYELAFKSRIIDSEDHLVVKKLKGRDF